MGELHCIKITNIPSLQKRFEELQNFYVLKQNIYLLFNTYIQKFDSDGNLIQIYNKANGVKDPSCMAISGAHIYICEPNYCSLTILNDEGRHLFYMNGSGYSHKCFAYRNKLFIPSRTSNIVAVLDTIHNKELFSFYAQHPNIQDMAFIGDRMYIMCLGNYPQSETLIQMYDLHGKPMGKRYELIKKYIGVHKHYYMAAFEHKLIVTYESSKELFIFSPKIEYIMSVDIGVGIEFIYSNENHLYVLTEDNQIITF